MNVVKVLRESSLFKGVDEKTINVIAHISETEDVPAETVVCAEGMDSDAMFVVASGRLEVSKDAADGTAEVMGELGAGDVIGALALVLEATRAVTIKTKERAALIAITRDSFDKLAESNIHAAYAVLQSVTRYLAALVNKPEALEEILR